MISKDNKNNAEEIKEFLNIWDEVWKNSPSKFVDNEFGPNDLSLYDKSQWSVHLSDNIWNSF